MALNTYPFWSPRFWHGMRLGDWSRLLWRNRFRINPIRMPMAAIITGCAGFNSTMALIQRGIYGRRIAATEVKQPPVFIIGHWRSGTTYLHELLVRDDRFAFPTTYECFVPHHFLITGRVLPSLVWFLMPPKRPMDNMSAGFGHPQEDEFALCTLGAPTPYLRMAFPNDPPPYNEMLDMEGVSNDDLRRFEQAMKYFLQVLTFSKQKRLVLKSPPHTGRIEVLARLFPGARFIHIVRDPYALFSSTMRLWKSLDPAQAFQIPRHAHLEEYVFTCFERMYRGFERQRSLLEPDQLCDVRYEDLVRDPLGETRLVYEKLDLGDFDAVRPKLEEYVKQQKNYRVNQHDLDPELARQVAERWAGYFERYGY